MTEQQKVTIPLPDGVSPEDAEDFAADCVQFIRDRTEVGFGVRRRGRGFSTYTLPAYTPEYEKFKGSSHVDLHLSGDLLDALTVLSVDENGVTVGYEPGATNDKAEGNFTGSYGKPRPNPRKARSILGMTREELDAVSAPYIKR